MYSGYVMRLTIMRRRVDILREEMDSYANKDSQDDSDVQPTMRPIVRLLVNTHSSFQNIIYILSTSKHSITDILQ